MKTVHFFAFFFIVLNTTLSFSKSENTKQIYVPEFFDEERSPKIVKKFLKEHYAIFQKHLSSLEILRRSSQSEYYFSTKSINLEKLIYDLESFKEWHELLHDHGEGFYITSGQFYKFWHDDFDIEIPPEYLKKSEELEKIYNDIFDLCESLKRASRYSADVPNRLSFEFMYFSP